MNIQIRKYAKSDEILVDNLVKNVLFEIFGSKPEKIEVLKNIKLFLVAQDDGKIVATIALVEKEGDFVVKRLYVDKEYRNKGLAQKMYDKLQDFAISNKMPKLKLSTTPEMKSAINFYERNGFIKTGHNKKTNQIFFEKELE